MSTILLFEHYMDEIFHIPQAQNYCIENFHLWDSKITTFPGLYIFTYLANKVLNFLPFSFECDTLFLRALNISISIIMIFIIYDLRRKLFPSCKDFKVLPFVVYFYPLSFFYYFLYYTDTISTMSVVLTYLLKTNWSTKSLQRSNHSSIDIIHFIFYSLPLLLSALSAIFARQTNVVWVLFLTGEYILQGLECYGGLPRCCEFDKDPYPIGGSRGHRFIALAVSLFCLTSLFAIAYFVFFYV